MANRVVSVHPVAIRERRRWNVLEVDGARFEGFGEARDLLG